MAIYRAYHINARGEIAGLSNFTAPDDDIAWTRSLAIQSESKCTALNFGIAAGVSVT